MKGVGEMRGGSLVVARTRVCMWGRGDGGLGHGMKEGGIWNGYLVKIDEKV